MNKITILNQANVPMGPFTRAEVAEKLQRGEVTLASLAFIDGLAQWTPLRDVLAKVDAAAPPSGAMPTPPATLAATSPTYSYAATMQPPSHLVYAGFWMRFAAIFIDGIILAIFGFLFGGVIGFIFGITGLLGQGEMRVVQSDGTINGAFLTMELIVVGVMLVVRWLYFALQECSSAQATLGKRALGIRVTDMEGRRIGFGRASGRFFGKIISSLILCVGYMMAGWTERKQALHDMIAGTLVVRNP
jgi:uncharacterized RDD family membrane protein YckC